MGGQTWTPAKGKKKKPMAKESEFPPTTHDRFARFMSIVSLLNAVELG
jgi:hypothetical protein